MVNDRRQGFGADMEISQTIQGYFSPGHGYKIFDDLIGNDCSLSNSPATDKSLMRLS